MKGLTLIFIGALAMLVTLLAGIENSASVLVYRSSAVMLIAMAGVSLATGARTSIIPMKLCPPLFVSQVFLQRDSAVAVAVIALKRPAEMRKMLHGDTIQQYCLLVNQAICPFSADGESFNSTVL